MGIETRAQGKTLAMKGTSKYVFTFVCNKFIFMVREEPFEVSICVNFHCILLVFKCIYEWIF